MEKTELHPHIFLIEDFLSNSECDEYIKMAQGKVFEEAKLTCRGNK